MRHPPYQLRTNKSVDRLLLVDLLQSIQPNPGDFTYYSLGGPFLEDLRVIDHFFPQARLCSIESNRHTFSRQEYNRFISSNRLTLKNDTIARFLTNDYEASNRDVFWLDYTDLKYSRFEEFQIVLKAVPPSSVVRLTVRAEPELDLSLLEDKVSKDAVDAIRLEMEHNFKDQFKKVLPHPPESAFSTPSKFAHMVQLMARRAASTALDAPGSDRDFVHVQSTRYNDNTQMVSITGIVAARNAIGETKKMVSKVRFVDFDSATEPHEINIPALTPKERHRLEHLLPVGAGEDAGDVLFGELKYFIDNGEAATKRTLRQYADYYREYPNFVRAY